MSSLLKALKQQQSPLVNQGSDLDPTLLDSAGRTRQQTGGMLIWVLGALTLILSAVVVWQFWPEHEVQVEESKVETGQTAYRLGESAAVPSVEWAAKPVEQEPEPQPTVIRPEPRSESNNQRQPLDLNQVSPELLAKFEQAVQQSSADNNEPRSANDSVVPPLKELGRAFKQRIQPFTYDGHMYVSEESQRWVELNQQRYFPGERFNGLRIERIEPQRLVLSRDGQAFSIEALTDWNGSE